MERNNKVLNDDQKILYWKLYVTITPEQWAYIACLAEVEYPQIKVEKMEVLDKIFGIKYG